MDDRLDGRLVEVLEKRGVPKNQIVFLVLFETIMEY